MGGYAEHKTLDGLGPRGNSDSLASGFFRRSSSVSGGRARAHVLILLLVHEKDARTAHPGLLRKTRRNRHILVLGCNASCAITVQKQESYEKSIKKISQFSSAEEFWRTYNYMVRPDGLPVTSDYHIFRA